MTARFVFVHGLRTSATMWRPQREALEAAGSLTFGVDLPGHGSRIGSDFTTADAHDAIAETVHEARTYPRGDGVSPGPVILVGHSLGGFFSIDVAASRPGLVDGVIAMGCSTSPIRLGLSMYRSWVEAMLRLPGSGIEWDRAALRATLGARAAEDVLAGGSGVAAGPAAIEAVAQLNPLSALRELAAAETPVWFVNGQFDQFRLHERRFLAAAAPKAWLTIVPGTSHMLTLARPIATTALLRAVADTLDSET